jgi:hypothetical protein
MTAFARTDIPATVTTLEMLIVWASQTLSVINPEVTIVEVAGSNTFVATAGQFYFPDAPTGKRNRHVARQSIELNPLYKTEEKKVWEFAIELSQTAIPASMKA